MHFRVCFSYITTYMLQYYNVQRHSPSPSFLFLWFIFPLYPYFLLVYRFTNFEWKFIRIWGMTTSLISFAKRQSPLSPLNLSLPVKSGKLHQLMKLIKNIEHLPWILKGGSFTKLYNAITLLSINVVFDEKLMGGLHYIFCLCFKCT